MGRSLLYSLAAGVLAVIMVLLYMKQYRSAVLEEAKPVPVVIATRHIKEMEKIDETMVKLSQVPNKYRIPGAASSLKEVLGQLVIAPIMEGEQISITKLGEYNRVGLALKIPPGNRALTVAVTDVTGVADLIKPGDFVDVLGTFEVESASPDSQYRKRSMDPFGGTAKSSEWITKTLIQNVMVLAVGKNISRLSRVPASRPSKELGTKLGPGVLNKLLSVGKEKAKNVTLSLNPKQVQIITLAQEIGLITLSLRSIYEKEKEVPLPTIRPEDVLGIKRPIRRKAPPPWLVIRGSERLYE